MLKNFKKQVIVVKDDDGKPVDLLDITTLENSTKLDFLKNDVAKNKKEKQDKLEQERIEKERSDYIKAYNYYYSKEKLTIVVNYLFTKSQILGDEFILEIYDLLQEVINGSMSVASALDENSLLKESFELIFGTFNHKKLGEENL